MVLPLVVEEVRHKSENLSERVDRELSLSVFLYEFLDFREGGRHSTTIVEVKGLVDVDKYFYEVLALAIQL